MDRTGRIAIGRLAKHTGTNIETIRYYERVGLWPAPARSAGGYRLYGTEHLKRLNFIRRARTLGFSVGEVRTLLRLADERKRPCAEVRMILFGAAIIICLLWLSVQTGAAFSKATVQKEFNQTYALAATGQVRLDNVNGKVRITAWDRDEVRVEAVKLAESEEELEAVKIIIDSKPDQIRIHTKYPSTK